ncbi:Protein of unknown function [Kaistia soli DSM 19436]|uniref:DUF2865 domain-containing protein n=1 Tax=Kaistia soli DSM 19436 TaxID=1122133 RepID=A0A1M5K327_9HYPH|nr:DUF2865 domain-containing protein [Kaistia soli]SHG47154.1 Protein of unknown function [Kaistia soli DSM 19436]
MCVRSKLSRVAIAAVVLLGFGGAAEAASTVCRSLEAQLAAAQQGGGRAAAFGDAASRQRQAIASAESQARRSGCFGAAFLTKDQSGSAQCQALVASIGKMKANLAKLDRGSRIGGMRQAPVGNRDAILRQLGANDCGPQYASYVAQQPQRSFLQRLFNPDNNQPPQPNVAVVPAAPVTRDSSRSDGGGYDTGFGRGTYRTLCVRTCDGYYFPISYSTSKANFAADEQACHQLCPGTDVALYAHRNPGQDATRALSTVDQSRYADLPTAFAYRTSFNPSCACGKPAALDPVAGNYSPIGDGAFGNAMTSPTATLPAPAVDTRPDADETGRTSAETPVATLTLPAPGAVRRVGPSYYYAQ